MATATAGIVALGAAAGAIGFGAVALERSLSAEQLDQVQRIERREEVRRWDVAWGVCAGVAAAAGATWLWLDSAPPPVSVQTASRKDGQLDGGTLTFAGAF